MFKNFILVISIAVVLNASVGFAFRLNLEKEELFDQNEFQNSDSVESDEELVPTTVPVDISSEDIDDAEPIIKSLPEQGKSGNLADYIYYKIGDDVVEPAEVADETHVESLPEQKEPMDLADYLRYNTEDDADAEEPLVKNLPDEETSEDDAEKVDAPEPIFRSLLEESLQIPTDEQKEIEKAEEIVYDENDNSTFDF